jgi:hypothetical protein
MIDKDVNINPEQLKFREAQSSRKRDHYGESGDTNTRVRKLKWQFAFFTVVMWLICTFIGKETSGRFWWETNDANTKHLLEMATIVTEEQGSMIENLMRKLHYKEETLKVYQGFVMDGTNYLNHALTINPDRVGGFPLKDWDPFILNTLVVNALESFHISCLLWVTKQEGWRTVITPKNAETVESFLTEYVSNKNVIDIPARVKLDE